MLHLLNVKLITFDYFFFYKLDKRSGMSSKTLSELMTIKTESPAIDNFDPTEAVNLWMVCNQAISKFIEVSQAEF